MTVWSKECKHCYRKKNKTKQVAAKHIKEMFANTKSKRAKGKEKQKQTESTRKKKGGPVKGKFYGYRGATKVAAPLIKRAGKTKNFAQRPSARACYDRGEYGPVCYANAIHIMDFKENGSPYWRKVRDL